MTEPARHTAAPTPSPTPTGDVASLAPSVGHYENFPVASWLCPPAIRPAVMAIYHFARTADDIADEGEASAPERLSTLAAYRHALTNGLRQPGAVPPPWQPIFAPLAAAVARHSLPAPLLHDLLSAFEQDVRYTASGHRYADLDELLAYCRLSANPIGRLLLHLYGVHDAAALRQSDQICSALQLINFWQDISVDLPRGRVYLPTDALQRQGLSLADFTPRNGPPAPTADQPQRQLVAALAAHARELMAQGAPLVHRVPGRAGWELRLVVQGGLCILDALAALHHRSWQQRPVVRRRNLPRLAWRALRM